MHAWFYGCRLYQGQMHTITSRVNYLTLTHRISGATYVTRIGGTHYTYSWSPWMGIHYTRYNDTLLQLVKQSVDISRYISI